LDIGSSIFWDYKEKILSSVSRKRYFGIHTEDTKELEKGVG
jgi:hypothetical protein